MDISIDNTNNDSKDTSNTKEYLENDNSNFSEINIITNENNNSKYKNKNKFKNEIEKLNINKSNDNNEFIIPPELQKTFRMTTILTIVGIVLLLVGILQSVITRRVLGGLMFWILSILVLIPGGFYSIQFYRAKTATKNYERQEILDSIPKLQ